MANPKGCDSKLKAKLKAKQALRVVRACGSKMKGCKEATAGQGRLTGGELTAQGLCSPGDPTGRQAGRQAGRQRASRGQRAGRGGAREGPCALQHGSMHVVVLLQPAVVDRFLHGTAVAAFGATPTSCSSPLPA